MRQVRGASTRTQRSYQEGSFSQVHRLNLGPVQFCNFFSSRKTLAAEQSRNFRTQAPAAADFLLRGIAQNFADLLFHAAAATAGTACQFSLHFVFEISDKNLSRGLSAIVIAQSPQPRTTLKKLRDVFAHLVFPVRPVMAAHRSPVVERMANAFASQDF